MPPKPADRPSPRRIVGLAAGRPRRLPHGPRRPSRRGPAGWPLRAHRHRDFLRAVFPGRRRHHHGPTPVRSGRLVSVVGLTLTQDHGEVADGPHHGHGADRGHGVGSAPRSTSGCRRSRTAWPTTRPPPGGIRHFEHAVVRLDPASMPFSHQERARVAGHVRPVERRPVDAAGLARCLDVRRPRR